MGIKIWMAAVCFVNGVMAAQGSLIISQYYEGAGSDKWLELYNAGTEAVSLETTGYRLGIWSNANRETWKTDGAPSASLSLTGTVAAGHCYLVANSAAVLPAYATAERYSGSLNFNGDDSIALYTGATYTFAGVADVLGFTSENMADISLVRKAGITTGVNADYDAGDWSTFSLSDVNTAATEATERLGMHVAAIPEPIMGHLLVMGLCVWPCLRRWTDKPTFLKKSAGSD
jgi:predicted extracellular nuclease